MVLRSLTGATAPLPPMDRCVAAAVRRGLWPRFPQDFRGVLRYADGAQQLPQAVDGAANAPVAERQLRALGQLRHMEARL